MKRKLNIIGWIGIFCLFSVSLFPFYGESIFGKTLTYGAGLGDLFYIYFFTLISLILFVLFCFKKLKSNPLTLAITVFTTYIFLILICYLLTLGRGSEHAWDGNIFL